MISAALAPSLQEDKEQLKQILNQSEYKAYEVKENGSIWAWLKPLFRKIRSWLPDFQVSDSVTNWLTVGVVVALLGIAAFAIYWFVKQIIWQKRIRSDTYLPVGEISRSYRFYWQQADELRGTGYLREGVRSVFLSLLFFMEAKRMIRVEKWKTNWEYAEELGGSASSLVPLFHDSSVLFERIWYGKEVVTEEQFASMYEQVAVVIRREEGAAHERAE
ncbi:DUF4129 domain-containing protein [Paenibacillus alginolyticus]|uniref:DUF4129 domain-containing protein n=1 Tax=Paenibacillus alginolyticus TaxID=59839 RepID=A0ABT4G5Q2_9BACL|nr:DUF4129 domain-containing protein [Paenibacillus alginolyticus]MCY9691514.1 DUF4129 domain-containing protein [Paenibacillus alginolyticus]MEC0148309.1 DUF4129 domain-containing protein [Paenibacillus alginolyticus]